MATTEQDYYTLLGVERDASEAEIKRAFRGLARELHPDVSAESDSEQRFRAIAEAYEVLSDPSRRQTYDRFGHAGLRGGGFTPTDFDLGNLADVFSAFFGESLFGGGRTTATRRARGGDAAATARISLTEAVTGRRVEVAFRAARTCDRCAGVGAEPGTEPITCPGCGGIGQVQQVTQTVFGQMIRSGGCPRCNGEGRLIESPCTACDGAGRTIEPATLDVDVPAGIHDGQRIRIPGAGHAGPLGGPPGDVYVQVAVTPMVGVERDGDDLHTLARVTITEAALGTTVVTPTPEGDLEVELAEGTQPGDVHVVRGKGMPSLETGRRGDLHLHVDVRVPRRLTDEQRTALEGLGAELGEEAYRDDEGLFARLKNVFR